jgi:hypothetical protein
MRIAKKVLSFALALTLVFGCLSAGVSAFDSTLTAPFQTFIDDAIADTGEIDFNGSGLTAITVTDAVVINGNLTIDFGGATIRGPYGCPIFTIAGGNVTIRNARFEARVGTYTNSDLSMDFLIEKSAPALRVNGGNVTLEGVICNGASMRVPGTRSQYLPVGSGLELKNGATLLVNSCVFTGRYGINNSVTGSARGGNITFIDGIAAGYMEGIKHSGGVTLGVDSIQYPAGDLIAGLQRQGVTVSPDELKLLKTLVDNRIFFVAQKANLYVSQECEDGNLTVTIDPDELNVLENSLVNYKWIPEAVTVNGVTSDVVKNGEAYTATFTDVESGKYTVNVRQRMFVDVADFNSFLVNLPDYVISLINAIPAKISSNIGDIDNGYEDVKDTFYNVFDQFAHINRNFWRGESGMAPGYDAIMNAMVAIGGKAMVVDHFGYGLYDSQGVEVVVPDEGILSRFENVYSDFKGNIATSEDICIWLVNNYQEIIDIVDDLLAQINAIYTVITTEPWASGLSSTFVTSAMPEIEEYMAEVNKYAPVLKAATDGINQFKRFLQTEEGQTITAALNESDVVSMFNKLDNIERYYSPYIVDETWLKFTSCSVSDEIDVEDTVRKTAVITADVSGRGTVSLENGFTNVSSGSQTLQVGVKKTLSATPGANRRFVYWKNAETNKIVSYQPSFEITVGTSTHYTAYFAAANVFKVTFLNSYNGTICTDEFDSREPGSGYQEFINGVVAPDLTGYTFVGWDSIGTPDNEIYKARYVVNPVVLNVIITNQGVGFTGAGNYNLYDTVTVSAPGSGFGYWRNAETGEVVSYFRVYSFIATDNIILEAVYSNSVAAGVALNISKTVANASTNTISFYSERSIKGYSVVETGIIVTNNATTAADNNAFVIGGTGVLKAMSTSTSTAGTFIANKRNAGAGVEWYARAYVIIKSASGELTTVYSNTKSDWI